MLSLARQTCAAQRWGPAVSRVVYAAAYSSTAAPTTEGSAKGRLYIGNLPYTATENEVKEQFASYGASDVYLFRWPNKKPRGMAFVNIDGDKIGQAINEVHGKEFQGRALRVETSTAPEFRMRDPNAAPRKKRQPQKGESPAATQEAPKQESTP